MSFAVGAALALMTAVFVRWAGLDRDRALYPTLLIVIALYYVLFAAMGGSRAILIDEIVLMIVFSAVAVAGFRSTLWIVVGGLAGHGVFDAVRQRVLINPGVPAWWPGFCIAYDVVFAGCLAALLYRGDLPARVHATRR